MKDNKFGWIALLEGILLIILGFFSIFRPGRMLVSYVYLYAIAAIVTGIINIIAYIKLEKKVGFAPVLSLIMGILGIIAGIVLIFYPGAGLEVFAILFPIWFMLQCVSRLAHIGAVKAAVGTAAFVLGLIFNILGIIAAFVMLFHPGATLLTVTYILGIYLMIIGIDCIIAAFDGETKAR